MSTSETLFRFYINSSLHVALAVTVLAIITTLHLEVPINTDLFCFIFFGAVSGYNFIKYAGIAKLHHRSLAKNLRVIQVFSFFSFLAVVFFAVQLRAEVLVVAGFFGFLTVLYGLPVFSRKRSLRTVKGFKVHVISLIWAGVSVLCPVVDAEVGWGLEVVLELVQRYFFVLVLLLPFEIRDLKFDEPYLGTIPQRMGVERTKVLGFGLLFLIMMLEVLKPTASWASFLAISAVVLVSAWFIMKAKENQPKYYSSFWVEGIPVIWLGILIFSEAIA